MGFFGNKEKFRVPKCDETNVSYHHEISENMDMSIKIQFSWLDLEDGAKNDFWKESQFIKFSEWNMSLHQMHHL